MLCEEVLGNLNDPSYELVLRKRLGGVFDTDELLLEWDEAQRSAFRARTESGRDIEVCLGGGATALADGDVLGVDSDGDAGIATVVLVRLRSAEVLLIEVPRADALALAHVCWEVGNMHAPLFRYESDAEWVRLLTPAMSPVDRMVSAVPGVRVNTVKAALDPATRFTTRAADAVVSLASDFKIVKKPA